jgi:hypothetical protein
VTTREVSTAEVRGELMFARAKLLEELNANARHEAQLVEQLRISMGERIRLMNALGASYSHELHMIEER